MKTLIPLLTALAGNIAGATLVLAQAAPTIPSQPAVTPPPEQQSTPTGLQLQPTNGRVTIMLMNETYAPITYQAIGDTAPRTLAGRTSVTLRGLRAPTTLTFDRQDSGLLRVYPQVSSVTPGELEVKLSETTDLGVDKTALRVEGNGAVSLN